MDSTVSVLFSAIVPCVIHVRVGFGAGRYYRALLCSSQRSKFQCKTLRLPLKIAFPLWMGVCLCFHWSHLEKLISTVSGYLDGAIRYFYQVPSFQPPHSNCQIVFISILHILLVPKSSIDYILYWLCYFNGF